MILPAIRDIVTEVGECLLELLELIGLTLGLIISLWPIWAMLLIVAACIKVLVS